MKKESRIPAIINSTLSAVLALLGFPACGNNENIADEYGSPYAEFQVSGLVDDEAGAPIKNARVISRPYKGNMSSNHDSNGYDTRYGCDTVYTDAKGHYDLKSEIFPEETIELVVEDPAEGYETVYKEVDLEYKGGSGWNHGTAKTEVNFSLKKSDKKD